jgi:hypothetical protein
LSAANRQSPAIAARPPWWHREWALYASTAVVTAVLTVLSLKLWWARLGVPLTYSGDALPTGAHFKTVIEEGWYEHQPRLSAPYGQTYNDFPTADNLHMLVAKFLGLFTHDWAVAMNVYFVAGFILAAICAVWFFRVCGVSRLITLAMATLFALAPYHFTRGESHLWLASYYAVPLGLGLLVMLLKGRPLWGKGRQTSGVLAWLLGPSARTMLFLAILASSSSYYGVFFLILLAFTGLIVLLRDRRWRPFWGAVAAGICTVVVMLVNMLPDLMFSWANGVNKLGLERSRGETEFYALKFAQLILPWPGHRAGPLRELRRQYDQAYLGLGEQPALGLVAACGFIAAFVVIGAFVIRRGAHRANRAEDSRLNLVGSLSLLVIVAFLFATVGGLSTLISFLTTSLRGWNRMSIDIAALALAIVGLLLDLAIERLRTRRPRLTRHPLAVPTVLCVVLLAVGFYDQTPGDASAGYKTAATHFNADRDWVAGIEGELPTGSMVVLLPYIPFPESSSASGFLASEQLVPYLQSTSLRWSNGGIKGRPKADWPGQLGDYGASHLATLAATANFTGIMIMRAGYVDGGVAIEQAVRDATGLHPKESADGRYVFFDLRPLSQTLAATVRPAIREAIGSLVTNPVTVYPYPGFSIGLDDDEAQFYGGAGTNSAFTLTNDARHSRDVQLSFDVTSGVQQGTVTVSLPDGRILTQNHETASSVIQTTLAVPPGSHHVTINLTDANGGAVKDSKVTDLRVQEVGVARYLSSLPQ